MVYSPEIGPPSYTAAEAATSSTSLLPTHTARKHGNNATNFAIIKRSRGMRPIKGSFTIDPSLSVPRSCLFPVIHGESRKNLKLEVEDGCIDVDISLTEGTASDGGNGYQTATSARLRTTLDLQAGKGPITAVVRTPNDGTPISPFLLTVIANNGSVNVHIPRSFRGPIFIESLNNSASFSDELSSHMTVFSEVQSSRKLFVGDFSQRDEAVSGEWRGDELRILANGRVMLRFTDEATSILAKVQGFLWRIIQPLVDMKVSFSSLFPRRRVKHRRARHA